MAIIEVVKEFINENFMVDSAEGIEEIDSLLAAGIMDSTGVLELITFIEETFSIEISDHELTPENLDSVPRIGVFIQNKLARGGAVAVGL